MDDGIDWTGLNPWDPFDRALAHRRASGLDYLPLDPLRPGDFVWTPGRRTIKKGVVVETTQVELRADGKMSRSRQGEHICYTAAFGRHDHLCQIAQTMFFSTPDAARHALVQRMQADIRQAEIELDARKNLMARVISGEVGEDDRYVATLPAEQLEGLRRRGDFSA